MGEQQLMFNPWYLEIWDKIVLPVLPLPEILLREKIVFYGEYLINAQGEDVVAGIRTPQNITKKARLEAGSKELSMQESMPKAFNELVTIYKKLEKHYRDMQDIEFTVENKNYGCYRLGLGKEQPKLVLKLLWTWSKKN